MQGNGVDVMKLFNVEIVRTNKSSYNVVASSEEEAIESVKMCSGLLCRKIDDDCNVKYNAYELPVYRYYCLSRPVDIGTIPNKNFVSVSNYDEKQYVEEIGRYAWGYVEYDEKLTDDVVKEYELMSAEEKKNCNKEDKRERMLMIFEALARAKKLGIGIGDNLTKVMDIDCACDKFGLRLREMIDADDENFAHDFIGIQTNINRQTKEFENFFVPRFASV